MISNSFNESQALWGEWFKQVSDLWIETYFLALNPGSLPTFAQKSLTLQEEFVKRSIELQVIGMELGANLQILFWDNYFEWMQQVLFLGWASPPLYLDVL